MTIGVQNFKDSFLKLPSYTPILVGQKVSLPCRRDGCSRRPPQDRGRQSRPQGLSWGCRQLRPGRRADARHGGPDRSAGTDDRASPSRPRQDSAGRSSGRGGKAAGPGGDLWAFQASRCLLGPLIVSRASQWGCGSRRASPAAPRGLHGRHAGPGRRRSPGSVHPSFHHCSHPSTYPSILPSVYPSIHAPHSPPPIPCTHARIHPRTATLHSQRPSLRAAWPGWTTGTPRPDGTPAAAAPAPPVSSGTRVSAGLARPAPPRPGRTHRGPFFWAPRNHMSNPRRRSSPPAHSGAERPATANNRNSVRVYYGCEPGEKKKII